MYGHQQPFRRRGGGRRPVVQPPQQQQIHFNPNFFPHPNFFLFQQNPSFWPQPNPFPQNPNNFPRNRVWKRKRERKSSSPQNQQPSSNSDFHFQLNSDTNNFDTPRPNGNNSTSFPLQSVKVQDEMVDKLGKAVVSVPTDNSTSFPLQAVTVQSEMVDKLGKAVVSVPTDNSTSFPLQAVAVQDEIVDKLGKAVVSARTDNSTSFPLQPVKVQDEMVDKLDKAVVNVPTDNSISFPLPPVTVQYEMVDKLGKAVASARTYNSTSFPLQPVKVKDEMVDKLDKAVLSAPTELLVQVSKRTRKKKRKKSFPQNQQPSINSNFPFQLNFDNNNLETPRPNGNNSPDFPLQPVKVQDEMVDKLDKAAVSAQTELLDQVSKRKRSLPQNQQPFINRSFPFQLNSDNNNIDTPRPNGNNSTNFPPQPVKVQNEMVDKLDKAVVSAQTELLELNENVSAGKVSHAALLKVKAESWDSLGFQMQQVPSLNN